MKRMLFLSFSLFLVYMAGMYRYPALMALGVGQALFLLFLTVQNRVCGRRMQAAFEREAVAAVKGEPVSCELALKKAGNPPPAALVLLKRKAFGRESGGNGCMETAGRRYFGSGRNIAGRSGCIWRLSGYTIIFPWGG